MKSKLGIILDPLEEGVAVEKRIDSKRISEIHRNLRQRYHVKNTPMDQSFVLGFIHGLYYANYITRYEKDMLMGLFDLEL